MADTEVVGRDYVFYVNAGAAPTTPDEVTNYTDVGMVDEWEFSGDADLIPVTHKGTGGIRTNIPGQQGSQITVGGTYARDGEAGALIIEAAFKATATASKIVGWLNTTDVTSDYQKRGTAYVVNYSETHPAQDISRWTATLQVIGDYVSEQVDA